MKPELRLIKTEELPRRGSWAIEDILLLFGITAVTVGFWAAVIYGIYRWLQ